MNAQEAGRILAILSAVDRREVDKTTAQGWAWALDTVPYERGLQAAKAALDDGANYVDINAIKAQLKRMQPRLDADVRAAKARGLVPESWPTHQPLTAELEQRLQEARADLWQETNDQPQEIGGVNSVPNLGRVGRSA